MTVKDDLHALINELDEMDAQEALEFLKARAELDPDVSQDYVAECESAHAEAQAPDGVLMPNDAVRTWLETWGTQGEAAGDRQIEALEERLGTEARDRAAR
jgi:hypothetical protein